MATLRAVSIIEQNASTLQGVVFDTAVYATAGSGAFTVKVGRDVLALGMYVVAGTQTSSNVVVVMDPTNVAHGACVTIKRQNVAPSTSVITVVTGSAAGVTIGSIGSSVNGLVETSYDGQNGVWR